MPISKIVSFGFKHGVPTDGRVIDIRNFHFKNAFSEPRLKNLTGRDKKVVDWMEMDFDFERKKAAVMMQVMEKNPDGIVYLGCTGGHHRSVCLAEKIAKDLGVPVEHRELQCHQ